MRSIPIVSVIVPAFNAEHTIIRTLNSLLIQSFERSFEVIVIDDGSVDNTQKLVTQFYEENSLDWKLISQINAGEASARNTGLDHCHGRYLLFLDADDLLHPNSLYLLVKSAEENQSELVFSSYRKVFSEKRYQDFNFTKSCYSSFELMSKFFQRRITIGIGNTLILGDIVYKNNLRFKSYRAGTDNHFFRNLLRFVNMGSSVSEVLFYYQVNSGSIMTATYSKSRLDSIHSVLDTRKTFIQDEAGDNVLASLDVFLVNEIRGNATDYLLSKPDCFTKDHWKFVTENILIYMPKNLDASVFIGIERFVWSLSNLVFYYFPRMALYIYLLYTKMRSKI